MAGPPVRGDGFRKLLWVLAICAVCAVAALLFLATQLAAQVANAANPTAIPSESLKSPLAKSKGEPR